MGSLVALDRFHKRLSIWSIITIILTLLPSKCGTTYGHGWDPGEDPRWYPASAFPSDADPLAGRHSRALLQVTNTSPSPNCTKVYTVTANDTCETLQSSQKLLQAQLLELNPFLNCKILRAGQKICVAGISTRCNTTIAFKAGPTNETCASIAAAAHLSTQGFSILNPGIICPETTGNSSWLRSGVVCTSPGFGMVFLEYIGASGNPIKFSDVQPLVQNFKDVVFHLTLAFASDTTDNGTVQPGNFTPHWYPDLDPLSAQEFKADNPGLRILVSIGGTYHKNGGNGSLVNVAWADPPNDNQWIDSAQSSLTALANEYLLDGVDVNYPIIPNNTKSFGYCIGTLIQRLKANRTIGIATISPYNATLQPYIDLMYGYGDLIDYVAFQFYKYQLPTAEDYIKEFNVATYYFSPWKVLATVEPGANNSLTGRPFVSALVQLAELRGLPGVAIFEADDSLGSNFTDQTGVLGIINDPSSIGTASAPAPAVAPAMAPVMAPTSTGSPPGSTGGTPKSPSTTQGSSAPPGFYRRRAIGGIPSLEFIVSLITGVLLLWLPFHNTLM